MSNYYEEQQIKTIERATLAEGIKLPKSMEDYKDTNAKLFLNIMTPMIDKGSTTVNNNPAPSTSGHISNNFNTNSYTSSNYITLTIPRYILLNFKDSVPQNTEFIIASVGGSLDLGNMRVIGIY